MLNPHGILLQPNSYPTIVQEIPYITQVAFDELLKDSIEEMELYYLVTHRLPDGMISWTVYTWREFEVEHGYNPIGKFSSTEFTKI